VKAGRRHVQRPTGTAVTRLALVSCTETGRSRRSRAMVCGRSILNTHYLHRDVELAGAAIHKPEMGLFDTRHGGRNRNKSVKMSCQKGLVVLTQKKKKAV